MYYNKTNLGILGILIVFVSQAIVISQGAKVNENGGYEIVIALREDEPVPEGGVETYVEAIKTSGGWLSSAMYAATDEKFHVHSIQLVLPPAWKLDGAKTVLNSYQSADIRISKDIKAPLADNPNLCGLPGSHIELPVTFLNAVTGPYGLTRKAFLNIWARYRWGVWEEHGYPGDTKFPYFSKPTNAAGTPWTATGCSNAPLNGTFQKLTDGSACNATQDGQLDVNCAFIPDRTENSNAKTSLMHFHFLESVERFCDKSTHNMDAPNKQNLFCDYKSVMEVIQTSLDSKAVTKVQDFLPIIKFEVVKATPATPLYVLMDRGPFEATDGGLVNLAIPEIGKLFADGKIPKDTIVALGAFPTSETNPNVHPIIPFTVLEGQEDRFIDAIVDFQFEITNSSNRDFGLALRQAVDAIKETGNPNGGRILIFKTGGATNSSTFSFEKEVELNLVEQNIAVYAIEVSGPNDERKNLANLADATNGKTEAINTLANAQVGAAALVKAVADSYAGAIAATTAARITWRGEVVPRRTYTIPVLANTEEVAFYYVTPEKTNSSLINAGVDTPALTFLVPFQGANEYSSSENNLTRFVYTATLNTTLFNLKEVIFNVSSETNVPGYLIVTADGSKVAPDITVDITTSAINNEVDLSPAQVTNRNAPFAIYARVQQGGKAVRGASLEAILKFTEDGTEEEVQLYDNGAGTEDVAANDGIYSGIVIPPKDGAYSISVIVRKAASAVSIIYEIPASSKQRLIPVDQKFPAPEQAVEIPEALYKNVNYNGLVTVKNRALYKNLISKVRDFRATMGSTFGDVTFYHTVPKVLGEKVNPEVYRYFVAPTRELLLSLDPTKLDPLPVGVENIRNHNDGSTVPGQTVTLSLNVARTGSFYYAVIPTRGADETVVSNIVDITMAAPEVTTTETPTTVSGATGGPTGGNTGTDGSTSPGSTGSTDEPTVEEEKPWIKKTAGIVTIVVIVLVVFAAAAAGYWYMKKRRSGKTRTSLSQSP